MFYISYCIICMCFLIKQHPCLMIITNPSSRRHLSFFTTSLGASRRPKLVARWPRCSCWKGKQLRSSLGKERYASGWSWFRAGSYWCYWFPWGKRNKTTQNPEITKSGENMIRTKKWRTHIWQFNVLMGSFEGNPARNLQLLSQYEGFLQISIKPIDYIRN